nr:MAG TPA_asm: hypothetical protein [Caudoviricetes sp.]
MPSCLQDKSESVINHSFSVCFYYYTSFLCPSLHLTVCLIS